MNVPMPPPTPIVTVVPAVNSCPSMVNVVTFSVVGPSPSSGFVSLSSTLPILDLPSVLTPSVSSIKSSLKRTVSSLATGASLVPLTVTTMSCSTQAPCSSCTRAVKVSLGSSPFLSFWVAGRSLSSLYVHLPSFCSVSQPYSPLITVASACSSTVCPFLGCRLQVSTASTSISVAVSVPPMVDSASSWPTPCSTTVPTFAPSGVVMSG